MPLWNFTVTHQNQTTATGSLVINPPGRGNAVTIPNLNCTCGWSHTLVGTQTASNAMSGSGPNSVAPPNDPRAKPSIKADEEPSWNGSPGGPEPKKRLKPKKSLNLKPKKSAKATKSSKLKKISKPTKKTRA